MINPFPGPQPYRAGDRGRFFGREEIAARLETVVLTQRCTTVFGPSGAGKSSVMQAAVIPHLEEAHDFRVVRVDGWPADRPARAWLADALCAALKLAAAAADSAADHGIGAAIQRAMRRSDRPILVYLDQIEQLLYPGRDLAETDAFLAAIDGLADLPMRGLQLVLSLREDYLGRLRDRARSKRRLLDNGFRVGPLTVAEVTSAMKQAASTGDPPQKWAEDELRTLMLEVRTPGQAESDEAEAQTAYAQIVCRALFADRAATSFADTMRGQIAAEPILRRYFETTLAELGPRRKVARELLEDHLISPDGSRTLRTEKELAGVLPAADLEPVLRKLEAAAILHAEQHQGSRYFEIGHDWLAKRVVEGKRDRERAAEERKRAEAARKREEEREAEAARLRTEAEAKIAHEKKARKLYLRLTIVGFIGAASMVFAWSQARQQKTEADAARTEAEAAQTEAQAAEKKADLARAEADVFLHRAAVAELLARGRLGRVSKLLVGLPAAEKDRQWLELGLQTAAMATIQSTFYGHRAEVLHAIFTADDHLVSASADGEIRRWRADGWGPSEQLAPPMPGAPIQAVTLTADGTGIVVAGKGQVRFWTPAGAASLDTAGEDAVFAARSGPRVVTIARDGTAKLWRIDAPGAPSGGSALPKGAPSADPRAPIALEGGTHILVASFSTAGDRLVTGGRDGRVRVYSADGKLERTFEHQGAVGSAQFTKDGAHIVTASLDATVRVWPTTGTGAPRVFKHRDEAWADWPGFAVISPDGQRIVSGAANGTVRIFALDSRKPTLVLEGHTGLLRGAAFDAAGRRLATASEDNTARIWDLDSDAKPIVLRSHTGSLSSVAWSAGGERLVTGSVDTQVKVWVVDGTMGMSARGHSGPVRAGVWSAGGDLVVTASEDQTVRFWSSKPGAPLQEKPELRRNVGAAVMAMDVSPDGTRVVTGDLDGFVKVWSAGGNESAFELDRYRAGTRAVPVHALAFSPDGSRIAVVSDEGHVRLRRADRSGEPVDLRFPPNPASSAAPLPEAVGAVWSPSGDRLAVTTSAGALWVMSATSGEARLLLAGDQAAAQAAAWSPDGTQIAIASMDRTLKLWAADGQGPPILFSGHDARVEHVAFSADGTQLVTTADDDTVRVWSAKAPEQLPLVLYGHQTNVRAATFGPHGDRVLTVSDGGTVRIWELDHHVLNQRLESSNTECLLRDMRRQYLRESPEQAARNFDECERSYHRDPRLVLDDQD
jgi:WD40 repeat protein